MGVAAVDVEPVPGTEWHRRQRALKRQIACFAHLGETVEDAGPTDQTAVVVADLACEYRSASDRIVGGSDAFTKCPESIAVGLGRIRVFQTFLEGHHLAENPLP